MKRLILIIMWVALLSLPLSAASVGKVNGVTEANCGKVMGLAWQTGTQTLGKVGGLTADAAIPDDTNLATNSSNASASTTYGAYVAGRAVDGNGATFWQNDFINYKLPNYAAWWKYDFGSGASYAINKILITAYTNGHYTQPNAFKVQGSNNDSDWTDVYTGTGSDASTITITFSNTTAYRYWRIYVTTTFDTTFGSLTWYTVDMRVDY